MTNEASEGSGYLNIDSVSKVLQNEMKGQEQLQTEKQATTIPFAKICADCMAEDDVTEHEHTVDLDKSTLRGSMSFGGFSTAPDFTDKHKEG
jgi:hypothetical protein